MYDCGMSKYQKTPFWKFTFPKIEIEIAALTTSEFWSNSDQTSRHFHCIDNTFFHCLSEFPIEIAACNLLQLKGPKLFKFGLRVRVKQVRYIFLLATPKIDTTNYDHLKLDLSGYLSQILQVQPCAAHPPKPTFIRYGCKTDECKKCRILRSNRTTGKEPSAAAASKLGTLRLLISEIVFPFFGLGKCDI
jgi:hypothetical protein